MYFWAPDQRMYTCQTNVRSKRTGQPPDVKERGASEQYGPDRALYEGRVGYSLHLRGSAHGRSASLSQQRSSFPADPEFWPPGFIRESRATSANWTSVRTLSSTALAIATPSPRSTAWLIRTFSSSDTRGGLKTNCVITIMRIKSPPVWISGFVPTSGYAQETRQAMNPMNHATATNSNDRQGTVVITGPITGWSRSPVAGTIPDRNASVTRSKIFEHDREEREQDGVISLNQHRKRRARGECIDEVQIIIVEKRVVSGRLRYDPLHAVPILGKDPEVQGCEQGGEDERPDPPPYFPGQARHPGDQRHAGD